MTDPHEILTKMVNDIRCVYPYETVRLNMAAENKILTAIKTATDRIEQQQRERVEKLEVAIKNALSRMLGGTMIEVKEILEAALAELEAEDDNTR